MATLTGEGNPMSTTITATRIGRVIALALVASLTAAALAAGQALAAPAARAADSVAYDAIPAALPSNVASLGFSATRTSEFGDRVELAGPSGTLARVEVGFSSWACESGAWSTGDCVTTPGTTFTHPVTVTVYAVAAGGAVGAPLASVTEPVVAPYRPSADAVDCDGKKWWDGSACVSGLLFTHSFDLSAAGAALPAEVIVGIAFDTRNGGAHPAATAGPYDALNVAVEGSATVGADADADVVYLDSSVAGNYETPGATGVFRADAGWAPYGSLMLAIVVDAPSASQPPTTTPTPPSSGADAVAASGAALPASAAETGTSGDDRTVTLTLGPAYENHWFFVVVYSDPVPIGWVWLGPGGTATVTVPAALPGGTHTIAFLDASGNVVAHVAGVSIAALLAATGASEAELMLQMGLGVALLLLGIVGVVAARRRREPAERPRA
ncbi:MAG: hypothetical protein BGO94_14465 [Micrococcales bacterium 72-143]|nr:MAG: hypothetical protein BGO94_14465 [Micrococcales bacterium 72-143]